MVASVRELRLEASKKKKLRENMSYIFLYPFLTFFYKNLSYFDPKQR